jgi:hypothetical protein
VFDDASVYVCAPTLTRGGPRVVQILRSSTLAAVPMPPRAIDQDELACAETWSHLAAASSGIPEVDVSRLGTIAKIASATADFRDQFYGLDGFLVESEDVAPHLRDGDDFPRIVTTGLVDLAACLWGVVPTRILGRRWSSPRIDRRRMELEGTLGPWIRSRSVPKAIVATQTRVLEVLVDDAGMWVPSIPLISVVPNEGIDLWKLAAALASPVASAVAACKYGGTAMSADAIKLSARQVMDLPVPCDLAAWARGARELNAAQLARSGEERIARLREFGATMVHAYGIDDRLAAEVERWWEGRIGGRPASTRPESDNPHGLGSAAC